MCTVTIVPLAGRDAGAFRVACNRDEVRTRLPGRPPEQRSFGRRDGLLPTDGDAGGTWIGANDAGLVMSLLNFNPPPTTEPPVEVGPLSRGAIIPALLHHDHVSAAVTELMRLDPAAQRPFRLVLVDRAERAVVRSDGRTMQLTLRQRERGPFMITSSGLGDHVVEGPRRQYFDDLFGRAAADPAAIQDVFHRSHWADRGEVSVSMARRDARTVSHTLVTVSGDVVEMRYIDGPPHLAEPVEGRDADAPVLMARPLRLARRERTAG